MTDQPTCPKIQYIQQHNNLRKHSNKVGFRTKEVPLILPAERSSQAVPSVAHTVHLHSHQWPCDCRHATTAKHKSVRNRLWSPVAAAREHHCGQTSAQHDEQRHAFTSCPSGHAAGCEGTVELKWCAAGLKSGFAASGPFCLTRSSCSMPMR